METEASSRPPSAPPTRPRLARSTTDRHLGGVAGGLAVELGLNVTIIRVAIVALTIVSFGAAISAYLAAWLLLPDDRGEDGPAIRWFHDHGSGAGTLVTMLVVTLLGVMAVSMAADAVRTSDTIPWIVGIGVAAYLLTTRRSPVPVTAPSQTWTTPTHLADPPPAAPPAADATRRLPLPPPPPLDPAEVERRRRHRAVRNTTVLTTFLVGLATSVLWATGAFALPGWVVPASMLLVLIVGLAMAPVTGWSWTLAALTVLVVPLLVFTLIPGPTLRGGVGSRTARPVTVAEIERNYRLGIGTQEVDLTAVELAAGERATVRASVGVGVLTVQVPIDATIRIEGHVTIGSVRVDGADIGLEGTDVDADQTIAAVTTNATGTIVIRPNIGIGTVDVRRNL